MAYQVHFRRNFGSEALYRRINESKLEKLNQDFSKYQWAVEWIQNKGDPKNVYFINGKDKWAWNSKKGAWAKTDYRQRLTTNNLVAENPKPRKKVRGDTLYVELHEPFYC